MFLRIRELISYNNILNVSKYKMAVGLGGRIKGQFKGKKGFFTK